MQDLRNGGIVSRRRVRVDAHDNVFCIGVYWARIAKREGRSLFCLCERNKLAFDELVGAETQDELDPAFIVEFGGEFGGYLGEDDGREEDWEEV